MKRTPEPTPDRLPMREVLILVLPSLFAVALFVVALFGVLLPDVEKNLLGEKKALVATLTRTGLAILDYHDKLAREGQVSPDEAKALAVRQIRGLRYGAEGKDYLWINDLRPTMIMHPYRPELEGRDLALYADPDGKRPFKEFVDVATRDGAGYVAYRWQWKDDPDLLVPKLSYVALYRPWGWIVGTGVYLEDVRQEIAALTRKIVKVSVAILLAIAVLLALIIRQGLREARRRLGAERELLQHQQQLESLVEERTADLQLALANVKRLSGFLPICASCKKIRDDKGYWNQIEAYIREHSEAEFSHSICPECAQELYPEFCDAPKA
jgi:signal transduction histidine kinase